MKATDVAGAVAFAAFGTATFLTNHEDAIAVFLGFSFLALVMLFIILRSSERIDKRILAFQEAQVKSMRSHLARFYILQRRKNRSTDRRLQDLETVSGTVDAIERNCRSRSNRVDNYYKNIGALSENQKLIRDHFHDRLATIEYKLSLAHDKAIVRLTLKGVINEDEEG